MKTETRHKLSFLGKAMALVGAAIGGITAGIVWAGAITTEGLRRLTASAKQTAVFVATSIKVIAGKMLAWSPFVLAIGAILTLISVLPSFVAMGVGIFITYIGIGIALSWGFAQGPILWERVRDFFGASYAAFSRLNRAGNEGPTNVMRHMKDWFGGMWSSLTGRRVPTPSSNIIASI